MALKLSEILKKAEIKKSNFAKPWQLDTNDKITGHKLDTNESQLDTNDKITGHKLTKRNKLVKNFDINSLPNNEKILVLTLATLINKQGIKKSIKLSKLELASYSKIKLGSIKTTLKRLIDKSLVIRKDYEKGGAKAKAEYVLNFKLDTQLDTNQFPINNNSNNKLLLKKREKEEIKNQPYKLKIKKGSEERERTWSNINIEPLRKYGLNERHLEDIREFDLLDREVVQESIYHFAYALEEDKIKYENPIGVFVGRLCKGKGWFEAEYISEKEKSLKQLILIKKKKQKEKEELINEYSKVEYEPWRESLNEEEVKGIELEMPESVKKGHSVFRENYWREYFTEKILMPKLTEKGLISKEEDHEAPLKKGN